MLMINKFEVHPGVEIRIKIAVTPIFVLVVVYSLGQAIPGLYTHADRGLS